MTAQRAQERAGAAQEVRSEDRAIVAELATRMAQLEYDVVEQLLPALRRLKDAGWPGTAEALDEYEADGTDELDALGFVRLALQGIVYAAGDRDVFTYWSYTAARLEGGRNEEGHVVTYPISNRDIFGWIYGRDDRDPVAEYRSFLAGRRKARRRRP